MEIYLSRNEEQAGPYSMEQMLAFLRQGLVTTNDLVWSEGWPSWMHVGDVPGLGCQHPVQHSEHPIQDSSRSSNTAQAIANLVAVSIQRGENQPTKTPNLIPNWFWVSCVILLGLYELTTLIRVGLFMDQSTVQSQVDYMSSSDYQVSKGVESFFRGMVGDPFGTENEIESKAESLNAQYDSDNQSLSVFCLIQSVLALSILGQVVLLC